MADRHHPNRVMYRSPDRATVPNTSNGRTTAMVFAMSTAGWTITVILAVIIWIALAFWPARVAGRKGHSFIGYFLLSLLFFPLALIMAYAVHDRRVLV
jgi:hypothetical protein